MAIHTRSMLSGRYITNEAHMATKHLFYQRSESIDGLMAQIKNIGPSAVSFAEIILAKKGSATGLAIASLAKIIEVAKLYGADVCEKSCAYAIAIGSSRSSPLSSIASKALFESDIDDHLTPPSITHDNIRGANYFGGMKDVS